jgi:hypothetical protein
MSLRASATHAAASLTWVLVAIREGVQLPRCTCVRVWAFRPESCWAVRRGRLEARVYGEDQARMVAAGEGRMGLL